MAACYRPVIPSYYFCELPSSDSGLSSEVSSDEGEEGRIYENIDTFAPAAAGFQLGRHGKSAAQLKLERHCTAAAGLKLERHVSAATAGNKLERHVAATAGHKLDTRNAIGDAVESDITAQPFPPPPLNFRDAAQQQGISETSDTEDNITITGDTGHTGHSGHSGHSGSEGCVAHDQDDSGHRGVISNLETPLGFSVRTLKKKKVRMIILD